MDKILIKVRFQRNKSIGTLEKFAITCIPPSKYSKYTFLNIPNVGTSVMSRKFHHSN